MRDGTSVHRAHQNICVLKVVSPVRPNLALATNVPHIQFEALGLHTLDVEALTGTRAYDMREYSFKSVLLRVQTVMSNRGMKETERGCRYV